MEIRGDAAALALWQGAGARISEGCRVHVPAGTGARDRAPFGAIGSSPSTRAIRRATSRSAARTRVFAPAYGPPFVSDLERGRRYGTLEDFKNFVKLTYLAPWLHHSGGTVCEPVDVPVNKRHFDMVYAHMRYSDKPFMGSVTQRRTRRGFDRAVPPALRRAVRRDALRDTGQRQRQLTAGARRRGQSRHPHLRGGQSGGRVCTLHPRGRDGPGHDRGRARAVLCRSDLLRRAHSARAPRCPGHPRQLPLLHVPAQRRADLWHARARPRLSSDRPARAASGRAAALRRQPVRVQGPRCAGGLRERQFAVAGVPRRGELHAARGRLARVRTHDVLREIRHGRGPAGRLPHARARHGAR